MHVCVCGILKNVHDTCKSNFKGKVDAEELGQLYLVSSILSYAQLHAFKDFVL